MPGHRLTLLEALRDLGRLSRSRLSYAAVESHSMQCLAIPHQRNYLHHELVGSDHLNLQQELG